MHGIWTLVLCLGVVSLPVFGLTQEPSGTLFLMSGPEVLHAGTPTTLAVTVFSDFPGKVTAELAHGDTRVAQTENFQGGLTQVLTLPPIPGSITQNSLLNLTVRGYRNDTLIFTNTTNLIFSLKNVSTFIQTDRSRYQPGDTVKLRIVSLQLDSRPYKGRVDISMWDPSGNIVNSWESAGNLGIVLQEFNLSQSVPLGVWAITTTVNTMTDKKTFTVALYERPPFEVLVKTPSQVLVGDHLSGSVRAFYPSGRPVQGTLAVSVTLAAAASPVALTQNKEIHGSTQFFFSKDQLQALYNSSGRGTIGSLHIAASVTNNSTGVKMNKTVKVQLMQEMFRLSFHDFPPTLRPSLQFYTKLRISRYDRKPLGSQDLTHSAVIEVTQSTSTINREPTTLTLPVPKDGNIHVQFKLRDQVDMVFISARFQSSEKTLSVYKNYSSPSGSYIQISPNNTLSAQIGLPLQINVESTFQPAALHFVVYFNKRYENNVSSRVQLVSAGTKNSSSFSLTPRVSWSPKACVTVYSVLPDGEVTSDTAHITINQHNYVSLNWSSDKAQPGEQVSLTVTAPQPDSQIGIVVMGACDEGPDDVLDLKVEEKYNIRILTNARLYKKKQPDGPTDELLEMEKYWSPWMDGTDSLAWLNPTVSNQTWTSGRITVPDGVTSLRAVAFIMSDNLGLGFTPVPQKLTVSKDFSLSLNVPPYLIRGEEIVLEVNVINHLDQDIEVIVLLTQTKAFRFVLENKTGGSVINAHKLDIESHASASAMFPIRPVALGEMEISVDAISAGASDSLLWRVLVKAEGVEQIFSETLFLELEPENRNNSTSISFSFPADVVPGSKRAHVALVGDILALSIGNLDSLVQVPLGCGEQNMIHFASSVYVLQYLEKSTMDSKEIRSRALASMMEGYQRQLSYQRDDGSFSAFGDSDTSGSTWLTAFVLRCFLQAQPHMQIDQSVLTRAMTWLLKHQGPQGEFTEVGRLIHTEMQGGLDKGPVALTAYVLIALLEDESYLEVYTGNVSLAKNYLEKKVFVGVVSNYTLSLVTYALTLANSPVADIALAELNRRADYRDGVMVWRSTAGLDPPDGPLRSAQIEVASYVLLTLFRYGSFVEGIMLFKWLSKQRNYLGGYGTTQDTVVAFQALAYYSAFSGANAIDLRVNISAPTSSFVSLFSIDSNTYRMYQSQEIDVDKGLDLNIHMQGRGFAIFQVNIFYNLGNAAFSQSHTPDQEAFSLGVDATVERDNNRMLLSICTRLKDSQMIPRTGMAIVDVGMLSGFSLSTEAAATTDLIRKVEILPEKVILYLDSLTKSEVCIKLPVIRHYKVAYVQDAMVQVYDYYEPTRRATKTYNSDVLHNMDSCFFCGASCDLCRAGISIVASNSVSSTTYSLIFLFLGVTAFSIV